LLGLLYFGGLWATIRLLPGASRPRTLWFCSFCLRTVMALGGLWVVLRQDLVAFFITLAAFFAVRMVMTRRMGRSAF
jgi:F1F0 ATPase subunit 2